MRIATFSLLAALPVLAACGNRDAPTAHAAGTQLTIGMAGSQFGPATAQIHAGDTVVFRNDDALAHTATATEGAGFDSSTMEPGATFTYVVRLTGRVTFVCQFHPGMTGTLTVR